LDLWKGLIHDSNPARIVALRAAGAALVVELGEPVPRVLHWVRTSAVSSTRISPR